MKKIYITTDIHNFMHYSEEHKAGFSDETSHLIKYLDLAKECWIKVTIFVTWKLLEDKQLIYKEILSKYDVEIWWHTYDCYTNYFKWTWFIYKKLCGCAYWTKKKQNSDIHKTTMALNKIWILPTSWRTHAYASNSSTRELLLQHWYKIISDLSEKKYQYKWLLEFPPNTLPDHENIIHPGIKNHPWANLSIKEWLLNIQNQILNQDESVVLAHATCHKYIDDFKTLEKLFNWIKENQYKTLLMKDKIWKI